MKLSYLRLGLILFFSITLAACGASNTTPPDHTPTPPADDDIEESITPPNPDLGDGFEEDPDDNTSLEGGSGVDDESVISPPGSTPDPDNSLALPEDYDPSNELLGNTSNSSTYDFNELLKNEVTTGDSLEGTWVAIHTSHSAEASTSALINHKYTFIIKSNEEDDSYNVANCSGLIEVVEKIKVTCVNGAGQVVTCPKPGEKVNEYINVLDPVLLSKTYNEWKPFISSLISNTTDKETGKQLKKITIPLFEPNLWRPEVGISLDLVGDTFSRLESNSGQYKAVKISSATDHLGTANVRVNIDSSDPSKAKTQTDAEKNKVYCTTQVKAVLKNKIGENTENKNTLAALYFSTDSDLQQAITTDVQDDNQLLILGRYYVDEGRVERKEDENGDTSYEGTAGSYNHRSEGTLENSNNEVITEQKMNIDIKLRDKKFNFSTLLVDIELPAP